MWRTLPSSILAFIHKSYEKFYIIYLNVILYSVWYFTLYPNYINFLYWIDGFKTDRWFVELNIPNSRYVPQIYINQIYINLIISIKSVHSWVFMSKIKSQEPCQRSAHMQRIFSCQWFVFEPWPYVFKAWPYVFKNGSMCSEIALCVQKWLNCSQNGSMCSKYVTLY